MYLSIWCPDKGVPLEQLYEGYLSLQQSKPHPNAVARTKTKWHVNCGRSFSFLLCCESYSCKMIIETLLIFLRYMYSILDFLTYQDQISLGPSNTWDHDAVHRME